MLPVKEDLEQAVEIVKAALGLGASVIASSGTRMWRPGHLRRGSIVASIPHLHFAFPQPANCLGRARDSPVRRHSR